MEMATAAFLTSALGTATSMVQQRASAKRQAAQIETQRRQQVAGIRQKQEIDERNRRQQLRRDQATQRARFSGRGIGANTGSASSLLSGLARNVDQAIADQRQFGNLNIESINSDATAKRSSLLAQSQRATTNGLFNLAQGGLNLFDRPSAPVT